MQLVKRNQYVIALQLLLLVDYQDLIQFLAVIEILQHIELKLQIIIELSSILLIQIFGIYHFQMYELIQLLVMLLE